MRFVPSALTRKTCFQIASTPCPVIADMRRKRRVADVPDTLPHVETEFRPARRTRGHQVPPVQENHDRAARVLDQAGDLGVPRGGTIHRISN